MAKKWQKWSFLDLQMVKMILGIQTTIALTKNGQKLPKQLHNMAQKGQTWPFLVPKWSKLCEKTTI